MSSIHELNEFAAKVRQFIVGESKVSFETLALELFALQYRHNPSFRKFSDARGASPDTVHRWCDIPAMPTAAFKEQELSCLPPELRTTVFHSSGTTAHRPSRHFHNADSLALYEASLLPWFKAHLFSESRAKCAARRLVILAPSAAQAVHSSLAHMFEIIRRDLGQPESVFLAGIAEDGSWTVNVPLAISALQQAIAANEPTLLLGTAFSFVHLLDAKAAQRLTLSLPAGSRVMETGGYKGRSRAIPKNELHQLIGNRLGIPQAQIICEYGMSELSSQAYDHRTGEPAGTRVFHFPPWARVRSISPETGNEVSEGETGLIQVLDLANVYSVMAVQTEDLGIRHGDGFELLGRAAQAEPRGCSITEMSL